jgi:hypothetical protein
MTQRVRFGLAQWAPQGLLQHLQDAVVDSANEPHQLAQAGYDARGESTDLGDRYEHAEWPVVQMQLERGGFRLAELPNEISFNDRGDSSPHASTPPRSLPSLFQLRRCYAMFTPGWIAARLCFGVR